jgi:flagellar assembly factor FliW
MTTARDIITFPAGLPGFESCRQFVVLSSDGLLPFQQLHSVDGAGASFLAIDPRLVVPGYRYELRAHDLASLGANPSSVLLWLALIALERDGCITVNLRAPIVINPASMLGQQVMPLDCLYPVRHVIVPSRAA